MAWIILEGLDRTGKSSVAELYKRQGYEIVHMSAPDKKYLKPGYVGPSYLDELLDIYMRYTNKDVVFDRSGYGEFVWPFVYNRQSQLTDEDIEILQDIEEKNDAQKILMFDPNTEAHWKRCVDNNEPLNKPQFNQANALFDKMARKYNFERKQLSDFSLLQKNAIPALPQGTETTTERSAGVTDQKHEESSKGSSRFTSLTKLEQANAINDVLSKRIIKQKGDIYDDLEEDVRNFLSNKLSTIFGENESKDFSKEEVQILKLYCKQLMQKLGAK